MSESASFFLMREIRERIKQDFMISFTIAMISFGGDVKLNGKNLASVTLTVMMLAAVFCGCSSARQTPGAPEQTAAKEASMHSIALDQPKGTPAVTVSPAQKPVSTAAVETAAPIQTDTASNRSSGTGTNAATTPVYTDVSKRCKYAVSSNRSDFFYTRDASMDSIWQASKGKQSFTIEPENDVADITGFYFKWDAIPPSWDLFAYDSAGKETLVCSGGKNGGLTEFVAVPDRMTGYRKFQFVSTNPDLAFAIANLAVYSGGIPEFAPHWNLFDGSRVDMLVVSTHPDDESVFLPVPAITAINDGKVVVTGYMTWGTAKRRFEAEEACWMLGERFPPTLRAAHDMMTNSLESMERYWSLDKAVGYIVELIRKYKPSVIVTHDVGGEYGHGAHMETSLATQLAFEQASDPTKFPETAEQYGVWKPGKLYLHMYGKDKITYDLNAPLAAYNGETVLQVATAAFERHRSQAAKGWTVESTGECSMALFGLFASNVGPDMQHDSMFENITAGTMEGLNGKTPAN